MAATPLATVAALDSVPNTLGNVELLALPCSATGIALANRSAACTTASLRGGAGLANAKATLVGLGEYSMQ